MLGLIAQLMKDIQNLNTLNQDIKKLNNKSKTQSGVNQIGCGATASQLLADPSQWPNGLRSEPKLSIQQLKVIQLQETQRSLSLKRKRGELIVKVEQLKRKHETQKEEQMSMQEERESLEQELVKIQQKRQHLEAGIKCLDDNMENKRLVAERLKEEIEEWT